jgi:hypothetical protein
MWKSHIELILIILFQKELSVIFQNNDAVIELGLPVGMK